MWTQLATIRYQIDTCRDYFMWMGKYTHGLSSCRGSRIWLTKHAGVKYTIASDTELVCQTKEEQDKMCDTFAFHIYDNDDCAIRVEKPSDFNVNEEIEVINSEKIENVFGKIEGLDQFNLFLNEPNADDYYAIKDLESIQQELQMVESIGMKNSIVFRWV